MLHDIRLVESAMNEGRRLESSPCFNGTRRILYGPAKITANNIILVTASGNIYGDISFNDKEIYFISSHTLNNGENEDNSSHRYDNATVNIARNHSMRRRRWLISSIQGNHYH